MQLGDLFRPVRILLAKLEDYSKESQILVAAQYNEDKSVFIKAFEDFTHGHPGHNYSSQRWEMRSSLIAINNALLEQKPGFIENIQKNITSARDILVAIPTPFASVIYDAYTPFSTYCKLRDLCATSALQEVIWIDPYLDHSIFLRYLRNIMPPVAITLVTKLPGSNKSDISRWNAFKDASQLYASERGTEFYRILVGGKELHDRWVLFDRKQLYTLGTSAKDAGDRQYFTLASLSVTPENLAAIQHHLDIGEEYFGPSTPKHRE